MPIYQNPNSGSQASSHWSNSGKALIRLPVRIEFQTPPVRVVSALTRPVVSRSRSAQPGCREEPLGPRSDLQVCRKNQRADFVRPVDNPRPQDILLRDETLSRHTRAQPATR